MKVKRYFRLLLAALLIPPALFSGCINARVEYATLEEAVRAGAVLGEQITIDGVDVSGMDVLQARETLIKRQEELISSLAINVSAHGDSFVIRGEKLGVSFDTDDVLAKAASLPQKRLFSNAARDFTSTVSVNARKISAAAAEAALALRREAVNASARVEAAGFAYTEGAPGRDIDVAALERELYSRAMDLQSAGITAAALELLPEYTVADAERDTQLIAEFSTSFKGSTYSKRNRVFNIVKAAGLIDGAVIPPGGDFSMNDALGPRNGERGWKTATAIRDGTYTQEYGGGVCQVSTTLYNAALMARLDITERYHHSWPLGYIGIGRDATISTGGPDLRIANPTQAAVFIRAQADEEAKTITVRIYGRPPEDGASVRLTSKKTETLSDPGTEIKTDAALSPGEEKVVREPRTGCIAETYREYYAPDGSFIKRELVTRDKYRSIKGLVYIGPAPSSPETAVSPETTQY